MDKQNLNSTTIIFLFHMKRISRFRVYLCRMVVMPIMYQALGDDNTKLEYVFFNDYHDGHCVFYISSIYFKEDFQFVEGEVYAS